MMEQYYEQPAEVRMQDARPDVHFQVGVTPEETERARNRCDRIKGLNSTEKPLTEWSVQAQRRDVREKITQSR
jgi:hypothetical protein